MAKFEVAHKGTSVNEGDYANDKNDRGGETWKGIARTKNPQWLGWKIIDQYRNDSRFPAILNSLPALEVEVLKFYRAQYWNVIKGDQLKHQEVANSLYDSAVNMGPKQAIKLAQRAAGITDTGVMDMLTLNTFNK